MRIWITVLFLLIVSLGAGAYAWSTGVNWFTSPGPLSEDTTFSIPQGASMSSVVDDLEEQGVISSSFWFEVFTRVRGEATSLQAGEFLIPAHASPEDILLTLTNGQSVTYEVTLPEGWSVWQIQERLKDTSMLEDEISLSVMEGTLLPETYFFERGTTRNQMILRMQQAMQDTLDELWPQRAENLPYDTPEQAMILASIVERETGVVQERDLVAPVMVNRLNIGMALQMDSTIEYGLTMGQGTLGRGLRR